jgi:polysaccharide biosynthesis/export protein
MYGGRNSLPMWLGLLLSSLAGGCLPQQFHVHPSAPTIQPVLSAPSELNKVSLPPYVVEAPDILLIEVYTPPDEAKAERGPLPLYPQPIGGQHLIQIDGTISLGIWGRVPVHGLTVAQVAEAVRAQVYHQIKNNPSLTKIAPSVTKPEQLLVIVDMVSYNSKNYFVITDGAGFGEQIYKFPCTGNETVLDALANIGGLPTVGSKRQMWIARRTPHMNQTEQILPIDYVGTTQHGVSLTNYQLFPGDRLYIKAQKFFRIDGYLQKVLTPIERLLGVTLLGSSTINQINGRGLGNNNNNGF